MKAVLPTDKVSLFDEEVKAYNTRNYLSKLTQLKAIREKNQQAELTESLTSSKKTTPNCIPLNKNDFYKKNPTTPSLKEL